MSPRQQNVNKILSAVSHSIAGLIVIAAAALPFALGGSNAQTRPPAEGEQEDKQALGWLHRNPGRTVHD